MGRLGTGAAALLVAASAAAAALGGAAQETPAYPEDPGMSVDAIQELPTGFAALVFCSGIFVAGLPYEVVFAEDCDIACLLSNVTVDYAERSATAFLAGTGLWPIKSIYRGDAIGCTVVDGITEADLRAQVLGDVAALPALNASVPWPLGDALSPRDASVDWAAVEAAVEADFACERCNTRAVVISYKGQLMFERYRSETGVSRTTRMLGWSSTKTVTNAFYGALTLEGRINIADRAPVPEWNVAPDDPRAAVTLENLLHMASGQQWFEPSGDVRCLFIEGEGDCAGWYANQPQILAPGTRFTYSSGGSTLLMRTLLQQRGEPELTNFEWPRKKLFQRLSMNTAIIEAQANTYLLGGSNAYMSARDWLRLGHLYERDGVWVDGVHIFPEGWVAQSSTPSPTNPNYGLHMWMSDVPEPHFYMSGFRNQNVFVFQAKELVVARFAMPPLISSGWNKDAFLTAVVAAFPE